MVDQRHILGQKGEDLAVEYLVKAKYQVLERNFRCPFGEVDIIVLQDETLFFVEVKTRRSEQYGLPQDAVDRLKIAKIEACAEWYLRYRDEYDEFSWQIDIIEIIMKGEQPCLNHLENADANY